MDGASHFLLVAYTIIVAQSAQARTDNIKQRPD